MGYGKVEQSGEGIHLRQFSRAFLIEDSTSRIAFVSIDSAMMGDQIKKDVSWTFKIEYKLLFYFIINYNNTVDSQFVCLKFEKN